MKMLLSKTVHALLTLLSAINTVLAYGNGRKYFYSPPFNTPSIQSHTSKKLISVYEAKNVEFGFPTENERRAALASGHYDPDSPIPIDTDVFYPPDGGPETVFITIPRFGSGVPYSLAVLTNVQKPNGTQIQPYPSYDWHSSHGADCDGLTSVYRVAIDSCNQMWILDSGEIEFVQHCSPQIVVIDLITNQLIHRYRLPEGTFKPKISRFVTPIIDVADPAPHGTCMETFVYMADPTGAGIVVYDVVNSKSWRIENKYTYPDPDFGTHTVAGESFELLDGAFSLAITPPCLGIRRMLYFHSLSSDQQMAIPLEVVNNATAWGRGLSSALDQFIPLGKRGIQCGLAVMTAEGILLCGYLNPIAIFGWNIQTAYTAQNRKLLIENPKTLQFVSGMKVKKNRDCQDEVWMVSNRLQKSFTSTTNFNEINYRIQRIGVDELLRGTSWRY